MSQIARKLIRFHKQFLYYNPSRLIKHFTKVIPQYDETFLNDLANVPEIKDNIEHRKGVGDIDLIHKLNEKMNDHSLPVDERKKVSVSLQAEYRKIPNRTHPDVRMYGPDPKIIRVFNEDKTKYDFEPIEFSEIGRKLNLIRMEHLGNFTGHKSYYLMGNLADLVIE